jgi:hypothetical protein
MLKVLAQVFGVTVVLVCQAEASIILHFFPVSNFSSNTSTMDAALGVTGFTEDAFETTTLISGLTIALTGGVTPTTFSGTLPTLFDQSACPGLTDNSVWDGTHGVINTTTNSMSNCTGPANIATLATFNYAPGATSFGIGMETSSP